MEFAIIETGGKQYRVKPGDKLKIEKVEHEEGGVITFRNVLLIQNGELTEVGTPYVSGRSVMGKIIADGRGEKKIVFKYHSKTRYKKKHGHRQPFTEVEIVGVK